MYPPQTNESENRDRLQEVCRHLLGSRGLLVASNRGPVEYTVSGDDLIPHRGKGGVVTGLTAVSQFCKMTWIASAMGEGDRKASQAAGGGVVPAPLPGHNIDVRFVVTSRSAYHKYYNVFSNPLLWFLQHYMWNSPYTPNIDAATYDAWHNGYVTVNRAFAEAIIAEMAREGSSRVVMLHDYQLYLAAKMVRDEVPDAVLQHFTHIPWPSSSYWRLLPLEMRKHICEGLCANDIVGFQTRRSVRSFLYTVQTFLDDAHVDLNAGTVVYRDHVTRARAYPISIDVAGLRRTANSQRVREQQDRLQRICGERTIVRVDRVDPSKNIVRGFKAYDILLQRHPDLVGKVKFMAFLIPSRTRVREYQRYTDEIETVVSAINEKYATQDWRPIELFMENNYHQSIAGLRLYDVLLVNAVVDGMNLVAKEGPIVNTKDGVLVLSEGTGAYEQLREASLAVGPSDLEGTMNALYEALNMAPAERKRRADRLRDLVEKEDISSWLYHQFSDLRDLVGPSS